MRKILGFSLLLLSISFWSCNKNCDDCQILDETGNLTQSGKVCDADFVDKCQTLGKRYSQIECDCVFQR